MYPYLLSSPIIFVLLFITVLGNALGPILGSTLYAAAINLPRPFDGRIVFLIGALILIILAFVAKIHLQKSV